MPDKQKKLDKLIVFAENENLALFDELQEINSTLIEIKDKEQEFPEIPETDLTETNEKLEELIQTIKEKDRENIEITLDLI